MGTVHRHPSTVPLPEEREAGTTFDEIYRQVLAALRREGRVSYRALKRRFSLDEEFLTDLRSEIITAKQLARDEDGEVLVWIGGTTVVSSQSSVVSPQPLTPNTQPLSAERRHLTVMFCDLVGSTQLAEQLDPEELRDVMQIYQQTCADIVSRYEGYIAQYLGDGLLVYFGYPSAHEDDARRAVHASMDIIAALRSSHHNEIRQPTPLRVRIGIHTGLVVIGEVGVGDHAHLLALGETPNLAARLQSIADPDTVVMSHATQRLVDGYFSCQSLGPYTMRGVTTPVEVYRVLGESQARNRLDIATTLTPLVGRDHELGLLLNRWHDAKEGTGHGVFLSGEPGVGKSRLVHELKERVQTETALALEASCSPYHQNSAFHPVIDFLQRLLQFQRGDSAEEKLVKLQDTVQRSHLPMEEAVPLLATFLSLPLPSAFPPLTLSPQKQKEKTMQLMLAWLLAETEQQPRLAIWEDLHWADPSTLEFLGLLLDQIPSARLLVVFTVRPEFSSPWPSRSYLTALPLARLPHEQTSTIIHYLAGGKPLPPEVMHQIITKTDGIPLFVEELTKMVLESGLVRETPSHYELTRSLSPLAIPDTLHDSLMARLDRLAIVREVVQLGATLGREFSYELLRAVSPLDETVLRQELLRLLDAEILYQKGQPPYATYLFKHALIQDAAYQSLLKSRRQQSHQHIATVLEEQFPDIKETQPELLAHHYTLARLTAQAIPYWHRAGQREIERSANQEAIRHLTQGIELLQTLPDTPERFQQELFLQTLLGAPMVMRKGYGAPEVEATYARARELCQRAGETPQLFPALLGLWGFYLTRGELPTAREISEQLLRVAQLTHDPTPRLGAHRAFGISALYTGDLLLARTHLEAAVALYDCERHRPNAFLYSVADPGVTCLFSLAIALSLLGYVDQARARVHQALTLAQSLAHPFSRAFALNFTAIISELRREYQEGLSYAQEAIALATEQGFPQQMSIGTAVYGGILIGLGEHEKGIAQGRTALSLARATGTELGRPYYLTFLARGYAATGQVQEGLECLTEGFTLVDKSAEYEPELYRLKGLLTLEAGGWRLETSSSSSQASSLQPQVSEEALREAEECFLKAVAIARQRQAKLLELRAVMSVSRLRKKQGRGAEARPLLSNIYHWFTEGLNTLDLQEAKRLLEELC